MTTIIPERITGEEVFAAILYARPCISTRKDNTKEKSKFLSTDASGKQKNDMPLRTNNSYIKHTPVIYNGP